MSEWARQYFAISRYALATAFSWLRAGVTNSAALFKLLKPCCLKWCFSVSCLKHNLCSFTCLSNYYNSKKKSKPRTRRNYKHIHRTQLVIEANEKYILKIWTCGMTLKSMNAPAKGVLNYLHTNSSCDLWSSLLLQQYTWWVSVSTLQNNAGTHLLACSSGWSSCPWPLMLSANLWSFNAITVLGTVKRHIGPNLVNKVDVQICYCLLGQKLPYRGHVMSGGIVMMHNPSIRQKCTSLLWWTASCNPTNIT